MTRDHFSKGESGGREHRTTLMNLHGLEPHDRSDNHEVYNAYGVHKDDPSLKHAHRTLRRHGYLDKFDVETRTEPYGGDDLRPGEDRSKLKNISILLRRKR
jgi:hypothetical protein